MKERILETSNHNAKVVVWTLVLSRCLLRTSRKSLISEP